MNKIQRHLVYIDSAKKAKTPGELEVYMNMMTCFISDVGNLLEGIEKCGGDEEAIHAEIKWWNE